MKTCPECQCALTERHGVYTVETVAGAVLIENASWAYCPACGLEVLPKSLKKALKRAKQHGETYRVD